MMLCNCAALRSPQQGYGAEENFTDILVATVSRNKAHTVKLAIDFNDGPHNDIVKVYVDGTRRLDALQGWRRSTSDEPGKGLFVGEFVNGIVSIQ